MYSIVQAFWKWKHYIMGKETIIHTDHRPLDFIQMQGKLQNDFHHKWSKYLQQPFEIETDASNYAIGVVLTQQGHPVAYHSETLSDTIWKYPTYEKEMYSIVQEAFW